VGGVLIDLGDLSPGRQRVRPAGRRRRPARYRAVLAGLAVVLVGLLTGAAHRGPPAPPTVIDARLGDQMFVGEDELFVVSGGLEPLTSAVRKKVVSAYRLPSGELLSRTTVAVSGAIFDVVAAGTILLISYQVDTIGAEATVALAEGTDRALWRQPSRMLAVSEPDGLVLLRENSPQFGDLTWSGVDLRTGAVRWSLQPVRGYTRDFVDGFPRLVVTATDAGDLEVRDAATGAVTATAKAPVRPRQAGADVPVWPTDDLVLVGAPVGTTAYALPTLAERWHSDVDLAGRWVQSTCTSVICSLSWRGGLRVLDPATGRELWSSDRWNFADQVGPYLLASDNGVTGSVPTVSVVDPLTGRIRGTFGSWHTVGEGRADGTLIGLREDLARDTIWYARLDPATLAVRLLGRAARVSGDCHATADVLVCRRIDASVGVWQLK
jgi:outer membrane protein assembly factor BamB